VALAPALTLPRLGPRRGSSKPLRSLRGRTALVTGASGGLGEVVAERLYDEGVDVVLSARRVGALEAVASRLGDARVLPADLAVVDDVRRLAEAAGDPDILVANAGLPANGEVLDLDVEEIVRAVDLNVRGTLVLTRLLLPAMVARRAGHVVLVGSLAGLASTPRSSIYNASKFALRGFGHALRQELRGTGVGVSLVSPTFVSSTGMWADTGQRARHPEVAPRQVADACVRAIVEDRAEILVAPALQRVVVRAAALFPELLQPVLRSSVVPEEAVHRQKSKR
jgi:short-subunit dehydrogenase